MFLGHFGVALAAKKVAPRASLGTLLLASQFVDLLWPVLLLLGIERVAIVPGLMAVSPMDFESYPVSHSLVMNLAWGLLLGLIVFALSRNLRSAVVSALLVPSHWLLDLLVHRPDLPLTPTGETKVGLGLWNSAFGTIALEGAIFTGGLWLYLRTTRSQDRIGRWGLWSYVALLGIIYLGALFGPPPPDWKPVAWVGLSGALFVLWAWWFDRHRELR